MSYSLRIISERSPILLERLFASAGADPHGARTIAEKADTVVLRVDGVSAPAANILKQQLLSLGGDAAVHREVIRGAPPSSTVYLVCDRRRLRSLPAKLEAQPFKLPELAAETLRLLDLDENPPRRIPLPRGELDLSAGPVVMGVLNVTPDSFSDGGRFLDPLAAEGRSLAMIEEGAGIIDIGGESTRPGAGAIGAAEELDRVMPVIERLAGKAGVPISIDTRTSEVARAACAAGAAIVNDVGGFADAGMRAAAAEHGAACIIMHMQGTPETMQIAPHYDDVVSEIIEWMRIRAAALADSGIPAGKIIVDPGIGFGKRLEDNLAILRGIGDFRTLGFPVAVGYSRKSFLGKITGRETGERLAGGLAALEACIAGGAAIVRTHDVKETVDYIAVRRAIAQRANAGSGTAREGGAR